MHNKVILVTASTRGIGLAIVNKCAAEGAQVYMAARNPNRAQEIASTLKGVKCVYNDATKPETFSSMVDDVMDDAGRIDVLVNNFGTSSPGMDLDFAHTDPQVFLDTVNLNLRSVFLASQAAAKYMAKQNGGSIINISSVDGVVPDISQIAYGTSKAAINYLTKLIAVQEAKHRIRCNAVLPGMTATEAVEKTFLTSSETSFCGTSHWVVWGNRQKLRKRSAICQRRFGLYHRPDSYRFRRFWFGNSHLRRSEQQKRNPIKKARFYNKCWGQAMSLAPKS